MPDIFDLESLSNAEEYVQLEGEFLEIKEACKKSEIQYLDKKKMRFEISEEGGLEFPDLICQEEVFLVSERFKAMLEQEGIDYVFFKQADICGDRYGIQETFWIMVPPRIDCIDMQNSIINLNWDFERGLIPALKAEKISIDPGKIGRFKIFKVSGIANNHIYVTEDLYEKIHSEGFEGIQEINLNEFFKK